LTISPEREAIGVPPKERPALFDEVMPLLRRLWAGETVSHHGAAADLEEVTLSPLPIQQPLEMWLGGMAPGALERCGRLSDGWLPSLCTPAEAAAGRLVIDEAAAAAGRTISPEHFGVSIGYSRTPLDQPTIQAMAARSRGRDPATMVPVGLPALRDLLEGFIGVGFSKFVVRPMAVERSWPAELDELAGAVGDLQT
jgi:probable F420-dependent oxidoreductase